MLWLAEVADASRSDIARELRIRPNAVSALQRRARSGLKFQWLSRQIPVALREETSHVARLLPQYLTEPRNVMLAAEVGAHTSDCADCRELLGSLRGGAARLQGTTLAVLLGSAGLSVPAAASMTSGTAAAAAVVSAGIGASGWFFVGGGLIVAGSLALAPLMIVAPALPVPAPTSAPAAIAGSLPDLTLPLLGLPKTGLDEAVDTAPIPIGSVELGRWITDPTITPIEVLTDPVAQYIPPKPQPADPSIPGPGDPGSGTGGTPSLDPGVTTPKDVAAYVAPMITGRTAPGNAVAIDFAAQRYTVDVAPDGSWTFDTRPLAFDPGTYDYSVWAFTPTEQSLATTGTLTLQAPTVQGFEQLAGPMPLDEARTTGLVISITGPANGTVWVSTPTTDATVTLDDTGHAIRRIRMLADGWYPFGFSVIDADWYSGPGTVATVDVLDPSRGPDWPRGGGGVFEIVDP